MGRAQQNMNAVTGDFIPELSLYVRFYILKALQFFYNNDLNAAQTMLMKAEIDMRKLEISDIALVQLESMGFDHKESRRALRFCSGNIDNAINQIYEKRAEQSKKRKAERQRARDRALQKKYGLTKNGKFVDLKLLDQLIGMGVAKEIGIEALRQTDNAGDDTLNLCLDVERREVLAENLFARYFNDRQWYKIEQIMNVLGAAMTESRVRAALFCSFGNVDDAVNMLSAPNPTQVVDLDRIEVRFVPFVQMRQQRILKKLKEEQMKKQMDVESVENDKNENEQNENDEDDDIDMNDDCKEDEYVNAVDLNVKAMPNPNLGDVEEENVELIDKFDAIQNNLPNEDDQKIEEHLLDDLDNDDESYLDIDLSVEKEALINLKVLLNSMQMNGTNGQDSQQSFLSLFKK